MTMTVKLDPELEQRLRRHCAASGRPASELIRDALANYLDAAPALAPSAYALGAALFGRFKGPADLAIGRKRVLADLWADKHNARR